MSRTDFDAIVVGSGPNGLAAAITLQQTGLSVLVIEGRSSIGGGLRSAELTLPGFVHDICAAIHPLAVASPFFRTLPLDEHGLRYVYPDIAVAHPFDDGTAAVLTGGFKETAHRLLEDGAAYSRLIGPMVDNWPDIVPDILGPPCFPRHPLTMAKFALNALTASSSVARHFTTRNAKGLWAGMAAHSMLPLTRVPTSAIGLVLMASAHVGGWPIAVGGSGMISGALGSYFLSLGGKIETGFDVKSLDQLPSSSAVLLDVTPRQLLRIAGHKFSRLYKWQLSRYHYGMGVFKIDWALDAPIPFTSLEARRAGTVHLGGSFDEISNSEQLVWEGKCPDKPFVLLAQQTLFDTSRAPEGKHTAWAYCHVPGGSTADMTAVIEKQVEHYAPGFRDLILARHTMNTADLESYNPNYIGGDINGGAISLNQLFTRPALRSSPYKTSAKGIYICSSSTPPGGGVHGMCGYHAAKKALNDVFNL